MRVRRSRFPFAGRHVLREARRRRTYKVRVFFIVLFSITAFKILSVVSMKEVFVFGVIDVQLVKFAGR